MALSLRPELKNFDKAKRERRKRRELTEDQKNEIREAFDLFDADKGTVARLASTRGALRRKHFLKTASDSIWYLLSYMCETRRCTHI